VLLDEQVQAMTSRELLLQSKKDEIQAMSKVCTQQKQDLVSMEESLGQRHGLYIEIERMKESEKKFISMMFTEVQKNLLTENYSGKVTLTTKAEFEPWFKEVMKKVKPLDDDYSMIEEHIGNLCKALKPFMLTTGMPQQELDSKFQAIQQAFHVDKNAEGRLFEVASKLEALVKFVGQAKVPRCEQDNGQFPIKLNAPPVSGGFSREGSAIRTNSNSSKKRVSVNPKHPQEKSPVRELPLNQAAANTNADSRRNSNASNSPRLASEGGTPCQANRIDAVKMKARRPMPLTSSAQPPPLPKSRHR